MKKYVILLLSTLVALPCYGEDLALNPSHPDRYVVKRGDTLWDISAVFLRKPWLWPQIWQVNPHVRDPNRIYPGDILYLTYRDGKPMLGRTRGRNVKLSPSVRASEHDDALPAIPLDAIWPFLSRPQVVGADELANAPYIVSSQDEHLVTGLGNRVYVRGRLDEKVKRYTVVRCGEVYREPPALKDANYRVAVRKDIAQGYASNCLGESGDDVLGYEALHVADVVIDRLGDPASAVITSSQREVLVGDRLIPEAKGDYPEFVPHAPGVDVSGSIISIMDAVSQVGPQQVVVINRGAQAGLEPGHVLAIFRSGVIVRDDVAGKAWGASYSGGLSREVELPHERIGELMVFRAFPNVSYALVMNADRSVYRYDTVSNP
ncbi:MAG: LysM peptidoglycan-binding domain-containing protein [Chromatiales bacterium]